jgi:membrane protease subunit HflC
MKSARKWIITAVLIFVAFICVSSALYTLKQNTIGIVIRFGKITHIEENPGLHVRAPFIDEVTYVYTGSRLYDMPTSDVITSDKKSMISNNYVIWRVTDGKKYYQTLGAVSGRARERIEAAVYNATKNTISSMTQDQIVAARGNELTNMITKESNSDIQQYGIVIELAEIKALDLPDDNKAAVYERMISERNNIAASYQAKGASEAKKIKNETDKQVSILKANAEKDAAKTEAEGEAEYMRILSDAYNDESKADFYNYIRSLDALESLAKDGNTIILDKDSEFAQILYGKY